MGTETADILPKQTLYIRNIYEKIGAVELKKCLYCLFSQFGKIADVQCCKTQKLRGQAWIIFADVPSASNALQCMNGFPFFDRNIEISYAKDESVALRKTVDGWKGRKKQKVEGRKPTQRSAAQASEAARPMEVDATRASNPPNKILFVDGLPPDAKSQMLELIFNQYLGLAEVRMPEGKPGIAFVEYDTENSATMAMNGLQGFQVTAGYSMNISYAKQ